MIEGFDGNKRMNFNYPKNQLQLASFNGMGINVLSIDENTVCVRKEDTFIKNKLENTD